MIQFFKDLAVLVRRMRVEAEVKDEYVHEDAINKKWIREMERQNEICEKVLGAIREIVLMMEKDRQETKVHVRKVKINKR